MTTYGFSTWQGRIRKNASWPTDDSPIGPVTGRDYAVNNAMHYCDVFGQNRVQLSLQAGTYITGLNTSVAWAPTWVGPSFPIQLRPDGSSYRLRVRVAGQCENASFKVKFAVSIGPTDPSSLARLVPSVATTDAVWATGDISSATAAYLTGASLGTEAWTTMIAMTPLELAPCSRTTATITDVAGDPISVTQAMVQPVVWTYVDSVAHPARLSAFSLEEWPG